MSRRRVQITISGQIHRWPVRSAIRYHLKEIFGSLAGCQCQVAWPRSFFNDGDPGLPRTETGVTFLNPDPGADLSGASFVDSPGHLALIVK